VRTVFQCLADAAATDDFGPCALTIGNFDGVHLGHRTLLKQTERIAAMHGWRTAVLTFHPHPTGVVAPERAPKMLSSLQERLRLLESARAERIMVLPFTPEVASMSPETFVREVAVEALGAHSVVVGQNFRFGHKQSGTPQVLAELGQRFGIETHFLAPVTVRGEVVSSSAIRRHLANGNVSRAARLLGRCFSVDGEIVSGRGVGSTQTVPTLNFEPGLEMIPANGVYITAAEDLENERRWQSITNVGTRPTFEGQGITVETFLLSPFDGQTPERIRLHFHRFIREERKFPNPEALKRQILTDVTRAKRYWSRVELYSPETWARVSTTEVRGLHAEANAGNAAVCFDVPGD
jgi:riboflavin kinase / FMN adenylyltransferase